MKLERLRGRKICERVLKRGILLKGRNMQIRVLAGAPRHPHADAQTSAIYIGTLTSTSLDKSSVRRNRMRRRCREAWRVALKDFGAVESHQLLIIPRSSSLKAPFGELQQDVSNFLTTIRSWPKPPPPVNAAISSSSH